MRVQKNQFFFGLELTRAGICLPDVSVYITLCDMLGISINEFFAGEDIREENYIQKSEDNLIRIAKDSKYKIKNLKRSIIGLALIVLITSFSLGMILVQKCSYPKNYITAVDKDGFKPMCSRYRLR